MTTKQVAQMLGCSSSQVGNLVQAGKLRCELMNRKTARFFRIEDVEKFLRRFGPVKIKKRKRCIANPMTYFDNPVESLRLATARTQRLAERLERRPIQEAI